MRHATDGLSEMEAVDALARLIAAIPPRPDVWVRASENCGHIGAMLVETAVQAGLNYERVVVPRVKAFLKAHPDAATVSVMRALLDAVPANKLLGLENTRKCAVLRDVTHLLSDEGVETSDDLRRWLESDHSRAKLLQIHGVKVKTAAYLRLLAGLPAIAIDVHLRNAAAGLGIRGSDETLERLYTLAAEKAGRRLADVDGSVWQAMSDEPRTRRRRRTR